MRSRSAFRLALAVAALAAGVLVGPLSAQAAPVNCVAPPGTSGIDQYCETVPAASGDQGTRGGGGGSGQSGRVGGNVSRRTAAALQRSGSGGKAILGLSTGSGQASSSTQGSSSGAAKGKTGTSSQKHGAAQGSQSSQSKAPAGRSDNPLEAVTSALSSGPTLGGGFIAALLAVTLLMLTWGWIAYRRRAGD